jgi:hypothetical protein
MAHFFEVLSCVACIEPIANVLTLCQAGQPDYFYAVCSRVKKLGSLQRLLAASVVVVF